jgi:hypothetical protein
LVVSSGSTLGTTSAQAIRLWVVAFNDAGTFRLGVINTSNATTIFPLNASVPQSSTAEGGAGAADSAGVIYTGTAVSSKSMVILGYLEWSSSGLTAGTWTLATYLYTVTMGPGIKKPGDVVQSLFVTGGSTSRACSVTFADITGSALSISPISAANALFVQYSGIGQATAGGAATNTEFLYRIALAGSGIGAAGTIGVISAAGTNVQTDGTLAGSILQLPNSTSSQAYTLQTAGINASGNCNANTVNGRVDEIMR